MYKYCTSTNKLILKLSELVWVCVLLFNFKMWGDSWSWKFSKTWRHSSFVFDLSAFPQLTTKAVDTPRTRYRSIDNQLLSYARSSPIFYLFANPSPSSHPLHLYPSPLKALCIMISIIIFLTKCRIIYQISCIDIIHGDLTLVFLPPSISLSPLSPSLWVASCSLV